MCWPITVIPNEPVSVTMASDSIYTSAYTIDPYGHIGLILLVSLMALYQENSLLSLK